MSRIFSLKQITTATCPKCGNTSKSTTKENPLDIYFTPAGGRLSDILRNNTFGNDIAPGRECPSCHRRTDTPRPVRIVYGPDILVMNLVRFTGAGRKNSGKVGFGEYLDLTHFIKDRTPFNYRLLAVVQHKGTINQGHYVTVAKSPGGKWVRLNDSTITNSSLEEAVDPLDRFTPLILIWARMSRHERF